jgi:hypothetical protein
MLDDPTCSTHGWSILNSAPTNSSIAGVLTGFGFTAAVIYVGRRDQAFDDGCDDPQRIARHQLARSVQDVQTISLFVVSFIILGLDSFVWSLVAGSRGSGMSWEALELPPELCSRVWSQAILAAGMLGLGAIAMVCNITSLFLWQQSTVRDWDSRRYLRFFLLVATAIAVLGVTLYVASDSMNYLDVVYNGHPPVWLTTTTAVITFGGLALALLIGAHSYFRKPASTDSTSGQLKVKDRMRLPTFLIALYALIGAVGVTAAARLPNWPQQPITWVILVYWALGLIYPVAVVILVARAVPPAKSVGGIRALTRVPQQQSDSGQGAIRR